MFPEINNKVRHAYDIKCKCSDARIVLSISLSACQIYNSCRHFFLWLNFLVHIKRDRSDYYQPIKHFSVASFRLFIAVHNV